MQTNIFNFRETDIPFSTKYSDTSKKSAESMKESAPTLRNKVLAYLTECPSTCDEVERFLQLRHQTASARIRELFLLGKIKDTGIRRHTQSGRDAVVWGVK